MQVTEYTTLYRDLMDHCDQSEARELIESFCDGEASTYNWRLIRNHEIDEIMASELGAEPYLLGCFNDWFLADVLDISSDVIKALQEAQAYEALGKLIIDMDKLSDLQWAYAQADGYGHHFSTYDGSEVEIIGLDGETYHLFRV